MIFGIDIDGVLAKFDPKFTELLIKTTGKNLFPHLPYDPPTWDWFGPLGYTKEDVHKTWLAADEDPYFWQTMGYYQDVPATIDRLWRLQKLGHSVYFITNRRGANPKKQTEYWLYHLTTTIMPPPTVIVSEQKGMVCSALKVGAYIDDKPENCQDVVKWCGLNCRTFLQDRTWNQGELSKYITRVNSVEDMLNCVLPLGEGSL